MTAEPSGFANNGGPPGPPLLFPGLGRRLS
jgi:hypothetical protein